MRWDSKGRPQSAHKGKKGLNVDYVEGNVPHLWGRGRLSSRLAQILIVSMGKSWRKKGSNFNWKKGWNLLKNKKSADGLVRCYCSKWSGDISYGRLLGGWENILLGGISYWNVKAACCCSLCGKKKVTQPYSSELLIATIQDGITHKRIPNYERCTIAEPDVVQLPVCRQRSLVFFLSFCRLQFVDYFSYLFSFFCVQKFNPFSVA